MSESLEEIALEEADFLTHITKPIRKFHLVDNQESLNKFCETLESFPGPYALDAERASGFKYSQRAYLLNLCCYIRYLFDRSNCHFGSFYVKKIIKL